MRFLCTVYIFMYYNICTCSNIRHCCAEGRGNLFPISNLELTDGSSNEWLEGNSQIDSGLTDGRNSNVILHKGPCAYIYMGEPM